MSIILPLRGFAAAAGLLLVLRLRELVAFPWVTMLSARAFFAWLGPACVAHIDPGECTLLDTSKFRPLLTRTGGQRLLQGSGTSVLFECLSTVPSD